MPVHSRISCSRRDDSNGPWSRIRWPIGETSTVTSVSKSMADVNRPSGVRCHGPSAKSGWFGYSRYERSSLATSPGLISCLPLRLSTRLAIPPPRDGSTDSANVSFSMASVSTACQPASSSGAEPGRAWNVR